MKHGELEEFHFRSFSKYPRFFRPKMHPKIKIQLFCINFPLLIATSKFQYCLSFFFFTFQLFNRFNFFNFWWQKKNYLTNLLLLSMDLLTKEKKLQSKKRGQSTWKIHIKKLIADNWQYTCTNLAFKNSLAL